MNNDLRQCERCHNNISDERAAACVVNPSGPYVFTCERCAAKLSTQESPVKKIRLSGGRVIEFPARLPKNKSKTYYDYSG